MIEVCMLLWSFDSRLFTLNINFTSGTLLSNIKGPFIQAVYSTPPGRIAQLEASQTADPWVASLMAAGSNYFHGV